VDTRFENAKTIGGCFYGLLLISCIFFVLVVLFFYVGWVSAVGNSLSDSRQFHFSGLRNSLSASTAGKIQPYFPATPPHLLTTCLTYVQRQLLTIDLDGNVLNQQVLLHLLRAGYYLHKATSSGHVDITVHHAVQNCPMRTIYFEDPNTFPEIDWFTYETAAT
jgi:hypothetical protein